MPGLGKTLLVRTLAAVLGCEFKRIQFTPDLMPADITGTNVFNLQRNEFSLMQGPALHHVPAGGRDQSRARQDAVRAAPSHAGAHRDDRSREPPPLARTSRCSPPRIPIESEGTYPLPEAQKDRFMLKIPMGWPQNEEELSLARRSLNDQAPEAVLQRGEVAACLTECRIDSLCAKRSRWCVVSDALVEYGVQVVRRTRADDAILVGAGPRATQSLLRAARAWAGIARP